MKRVLLWQQTRGSWWVLFLSSDLYQLVLLIFPRSAAFGRRLQEEQPGQITGPDGARLCLRAARSVRADLCDNDGRKPAARRGPLGRRTLLQGQQTDVESGSVPMLQLKPNMFWFCPTKILHKVQISQNWILLPFLLYSIHLPTFSFWKNSTLRNVFTTSYFGSPSVQRAFWRHFEKSRMYSTDPALQNHQLIS